MKTYFFPASEFDEIIHVDYGNSLDLELSKFKNSSCEFDKKILPRSQRQLATSHGNELIFGNSVYNDASIAISGNVLIDDLPTLKRRRRRANKRQNFRSSSLASFILRPLLFLPCYFGFHRWRESTSMPERVCYICRQRIGTFV